MGWGAEVGGEVMLARVACLLLSLSVREPQFAPPDQAVVALVGGTVIDGNGGAPIPDAVVLIQGQRITKVGPAAVIPVPVNATRIDVRGKYLIPGFIDMNLHVTPYGSPDSDPDEVVANALQAARQLLEHGVTTARDTYGFLQPLLATRDSLRKYPGSGARLLFSGNIIGWGDKTTYSNLGPFAAAADRVATPTDSAHSRLTVPKIDIVQDMGENLIGVEARTLRPIIAKYLDKGVDFIKIGVTTHVSMPPVFILFSPRSLSVMVEEAHRRGKAVDVHAVSSEGVRMAIQAGVDVVQHPESIGGYPVSDELAELFAKRGVTCAIMSAHFTGPNWKIRRAGEETQTRERTNAQRLIKRGCRVAVASDDYLFNSEPIEVTVSPGSVAAPDTIKKTSMRPHTFGPATLRAIEGLVELGMSPTEALKAATRNGAIAAGLQQYGTIAPGKQADVLVLSENPLEDIRNIRKLEMVIKGGRVAVRK
jgi:imidazolonepropionase-like amidohydrolase